jgi:rRNA processing protein Gar1
MNGTEPVVSDVVNVRVGVVVEVATEPENPFALVKAKEETPPPPPVGIS